MKLKFFLIIFLISLGLASCDIFDQFVGGSIIPTATKILATEPINTVIPTATEIPIPTTIPTSIPPSPTASPAVQNPTSTPVDVEPEEEFQQVFDIQPGSPIKIHAWNHGCDWMGIAGQVFLDDGQPAEGFIVEVGGTLGGQNILGLSITGSEGVYGSGGYEIKFSDQLVDSSSAVWVQLKSTIGEPLMEKIFLETVDDCNQNLILFNFIQTGPFNNMVTYFPLVIK